MSSGKCTFTAPALRLSMVVLLALASTAPARAGEPSFQGLGSLPGAVPGSLASDISGDGQVVVGGCPSGATCAEAWRWTESGGIQGVGFLPGETRSFATATSFDGSAVLGISASVFRWTSSGIVDIGAGVVPAGAQVSAEDLSSDGLVAVGGFVDSATLQGGAYRWTPAAGMEILEPFTLPMVVAFTAVSSDGSLIAGGSGVPDDPVAFVRTGSGTTFLPELPSAGCQCGSLASGISGDGSTVVGSSQEQAFRWTAATGTRALGPLPGSVYGDAKDVSDDGAVVVGSTTLPAGDAAFLWTQPAGLQELREVLVLGGVDLTGWDLTEAVAISDDGTAIAGNGTNPSGRPEAWIAIVPRNPIPFVPGVSVPGAVALLALTCLVGVVFARRRLARAS